MDEREHFLIAMYNQLMNDINRHIVVVWQSIATLVAAIAAFTLVGEGLITFDVATSIILLTSFWLILHVVDASYWYNRNLTIIANIERQFLSKDDLKDIHYYFGKHRPNNSMISHLKIQLYLGVSVILIFLIFHFDNVMIEVIADCSKLEVINLLPWAVAIFGTIYSVRASSKNKEKYAEFLRESPGIKVDTSDTSYGIGHGFDGKNT